MTLLKTELQRARRAGVAYLLGSNPKTVKSDNQGEWLTAIMHLAPAKLSGYQTCASSTAECRAACLNGAGQGSYHLHPSIDVHPIQQARIRRTRLFFRDRDAFLALLLRDLRKHVAKAERLGVRPAVRLNGTSDIMWERVTPWLFRWFPQVQFYDYTAHITRCWEAHRLPSNYHLTYSHKGHETDLDLKLIQRRCNVATVFLGCTHRSTRCHCSKLPSTWRGVPVIDGDAHDLRFLDPPGSVVGLNAKGDARTVPSSFVVRWGDAKDTTQQRANMGVLWRDSDYTSGRQLVTIGGV